MSKIYQALELEQRKKDSDDPLVYAKKPQMKDLEKGFLNETVAWENRNPEIEEEFINLYYTVHGLLGQKKGKVIQFVGTSERDDTGSVIEQFGRVSTTGLGKSVLLIRTQRNGHTLSLPAMQDPNEHALARLGDGASAEEVFSDHGEPCFFVWSLSSVSCMETVRSPERFQSVLSKLRARFDLILVEMPPLSSSPVGLAACSLVDGIILVIEAEKTKASAAMKIKQRIQVAGGNVLGVVLNKHRSHIPQLLDGRL